MNDSLHHQTHYKTEIAPKITTFMRLELIFRQYLRQITQTADMFPRFTFTFNERMTKQMTGLELE
jgi:hypothetical protein